jgi:hypothetical protein
VPVLMGMLGVGIYSAKRQQEEARTGGDVDALDADAAHTHNDRHPVPLAQLVQLEAARRAADMQAALMS